jgi:predicted AAA+ superfamily ATPase
MKSWLKDPEFEGKLFESVAVNRFARLKPQVYFWYSAKEKKEVDLVIPAEEPGQAPTLFEIKLSDGKSFRALNQEVAILTKESFLSGVL